MYEDKVVDFLFGKSQITDHEATREQLEADLESEEGHVHGPGCGHDHGAEKAKPKKSAAKKAESKEKVSAKGPAPATAKSGAKKTEVGQKVVEPKGAKPKSGGPADTSAPPAVAKKAAAKAAPKAESKSAPKPKKPAKKG